MRPWPGLFLSLLKKTSQYERGEKNFLAGQLSRLVLKICFYFYLFLYFFLYLFFLLSDKTSISFGIPPFFFRANQITDRACHLTYVLVQILVN